MRVNRITATAVTVSLAGSLALGAAAVAGAVPAVSADHGPGHGSGIERPRDAQPDAAEVTAATARTAQQTGAMREAVRPVTQMAKVLVAVSKLKEGKLSAEQAERFRVRMDRAIKPLTKSRTAAEGARTAARMAPAAPTRDMTANAAADLRTRMHTLLNAAVHGTAEQRTAAATRALAGGSNLLAASLYSGRLAAPDLKGLPKMPSTAQLPQTPQAQTPQAPKQQAPQKQAPKQQQAPQQGQKPQAPQAPQGEQAPKSEQAQQAPAAPVTPEQGR